ncbi:ureidoglycolate hydrolase [Vigna umbellata]|uniref:ureidoglycolate hydrolase n=1 Tax=Vigna umbellata TaxID=87088 RepID=UPI001F5F5759|nr:ureidoglycolate hydrolase [Vigna umbellata]
MVHSVLLFLVLTLTAVSAQQHQYDDPSITATMEKFSGYAINEPHSFQLTSLSVDAQALQNQIDELAAFSDSPAPSVTRVLFTDKDVLGRNYVKTQMELAGLSVREDAVGNIFGRWEGLEPELAAVATGSHVDAIPYSGKYDGVVGVLGAIEAIRVLKRSGFKPRRSLEVISFTSEEPTRFGIGCLGSRLLAGSEDLANALKTTTDIQNISFLDAARSAGYGKNGDDLSSVFLKKGTYSAFIELHIEQGPILEDEGISIGIVTAIAAPASLKVEFEGNGGHAGAVLMPNRNDAGLAASELALAVERHVLESGSIDTVGTVGILELHPGAINSIPSKSHLEIDTRDIDEERRNKVVEKIHQSAIKITKTRGVKLSDFRVINQDPPALSDEAVIKAVEIATKELNLTSKLMISRAYHDSLFMARLSPMGMIFIPCYKGYSHKPEEFASIQDMSNGVKVLALTLAKLSSQLHLLK